MAASKKQQSKVKTVGLVALILALAVIIPIGLFLGAATLFTYANFNSENARMDARYNAEVQLNSIEGTTGSVVIENLGGTPPTKKSLLVNLYVDQVPEGIILTNMVKFAFSTKWLQGDIAFDREWRCRGIRLVAEGRKTHAQALEFKPKHRSLVSAAAPTPALAGSQFVFSDRTAHRGGVHRFRSRAKPPDRHQLPSGRPQSRRQSRR